MNQDLIALSRTISHALRHEPWLYELELDPEGWIGVDLLISALGHTNEQWRNLNESDLLAMITASDKQRHELSNGKIRALYGHSLPQTLLKQAATPPEILFHGTSPKAIAQIQSEGLRPMNRQYVHLSTNQETAQQVGKRKTTTPIILCIDALSAHGNGIPFYRGNDIVWLADQIPPEFMTPIK